MQSSFLGPLGLLLHLQTTIGDHHRMVRRRSRGKIGSVWGWISGGREDRIEEVGNKNVRRA